MSTFRVLVDGKPVTVGFERKAVQGNRDITPQLRGLGLSDEQMFDSFELTPEQWNAFEALDIGKQVLLHDDSTDWQVAVTAIWAQTFPAGKETFIEHTYTPRIGYVYTEPYFHGRLDLALFLPDETGQRTCLDHSTSRIIEDRISSEIAKNRAIVGVNTTDLEYILATGRNWKGPIGEFTLRIEKEAPDQIMSVCFPGTLKQVSPTVYEFHQKDFVPPDKLVVYFYTLEPKFIEPKRW